MLVTRVRDRDRRPVGLELFTLAYLVWWLAPIAVIVRASFSVAGQPNEVTGLSLDWYRAALEDDVTREALFQSAGLAGWTVALAVPLGAGAAIGLRRWRGSLRDVSLVVVISAIVAPQIALGTAMFLALTEASPIRLGTVAQLLGHVTIAIPFVVVLCWIGLDTVPAQQEEGAMDLGAGPVGAVWRVIVPQILPAAAVAAFAAWLLSFDNLVLSSWLCLRHDCVTVPMLLYGRAGPQAGPLLYAVGTLAMAATALLAALAAPWILRLARDRAEATRPDGRSRPRPVV